MIFRNFLCFCRESGLRCDFLSTKFQTRAEPNSEKTLYRALFIGHGGQSVIQVNTKTKYVIVAVVVVIIIVAGIGAYLIYNNGKSSGTPTVNVADANSLQFVANATSSGTTSTLNFAGENLQTSNYTIRIDYPAGNTSFILNYGQQKSWQSLDNGKTWTLDSSFAADNSTWGERWTGEVTALENWNGTGDTYTYTTTSGGVTTNVIIYDISVNPSLPESLFSPS